MSIDYMALHFAGDPPVVRPNSFNEEEIAYLRSYLGEDDPPPYEGVGAANSVDFMIALYTGASKEEVEAVLERLKEWEPLDTAQPAEPAKLPLAVKDVSSLAEHWADTLEQAGIKYAHELADRSRTSLEKIKGIGRKTAASLLADAKAALAKEEPEE